jgi:DMSO reductase family type II enzyme chaperone
MDQKDKVISLGEDERDRAVEALLARSDVYKLLSLGFLYPDKELLALLEGSDLLEDIGEFLPDQVQGIESLISIVSGLPLSEVEAEHRKIFGVGSISKDCPPYETEYGGMHVFMQSNELGDICGFYGAFGLDSSENVKERPDHISIELEFMYFLTYKEAYALRYDHGEEKLGLIKDAQKRFMKEHLAKWIPVFSDFVSKGADTVFYKELALLLKEFIASECRLLGVKPRTDQIFLKSPGYEPGTFSCSDTPESGIPI